MNSIVSLDPTMLRLWINLDDYPPLALAFCIVGCLLWLVAYAAIIRSFFRYSFVEMPAVALVGNIAWEFIWGFPFQPDLGLLFEWMYRGAFFLDIFILWGLLRFGTHQVATPLIRHFFTPAVLFGVAGFGVVLYFFTLEGYDNSYGAISAYILQILMGVLYIVNFIRQDGRRFSAVVAWGRVWGTGFITVFNLLVTNNLFLISLCIVATMIDGFYLFLFHGWPRLRVSFAEFMEEVPKTA